MINVIVTTVPVGWVGVVLWVYYSWLCEVVACTAAISPVAAGEVGVKTMHALRPHNAESSKCSRQVLISIVCVAASAMRDINSAR